MKVGNQLAQTKLSQTALQRADNLNLRKAACGINIDTRDN